MLFLPRLPSYLFRFHGTRSFLRCRDCISLKPTAPFCARALETQSREKLAKDIILYKFNNPRFYTYLNVFALVQFFFWGFVGQFSVSSLRDVPVPETADEKLPWWQRVNLGEDKYKKSLAVVCYLFGTCVLGFSWMFTLRSVRYLILNKGGNKVSVVTYAPFGENRILTVPLEKVSALQSRTSAQSTLPLKVSGTRFYYLMDMRGEFTNPQLFDITAGLKRKLP